MKLITGKYNIRQETPNITRQNVYNIKKTKQKNPSTRPIITRVDSCLPKGARIRPTPLSVLEIEPGAKWHRQ